MRHLIVLLVVIAVPQAWAGVYKWTDEEGYVHYSDKPAGQAEELSVPGLPASDTAGSAKEAEAPDKGEVDAWLNEDEQEDKGYGQFEIVSPEEGQTFRNDEGELEVGMLLQPALKSGHKIQVFVDANPVQADFSSTQMILRNLSRGTHQLQAKIIDDQGEVQATSKLINFHMRRAASSGLADK